MDIIAQLNCPAEVVEQVDLIVESIRRILTTNLRGIYLHGSLAMGCFNPTKSDIDLLIFTHHPISLADKRKFAELMLNLYGKPRPIEVSLLHTNQFIPWRHPTPFDFHFGDNLLTKLQSDIDTAEWLKWNEEEKVDEDLAAHFTMTRQQGICLYGEPIDTIIPEIPLEDFANSLLADLKSSREHVTQYPLYGILNHCRACAFFEDRLFLSKLEGAVWALIHLPPAYQGLISVAREAYIGDKMPNFVVSEVLAFMDLIEEGVVKNQNHNSL